MDSHGVTLTVMDPQLLPKSTTLGLHTKLSFGAEEMNQDYKLQSTKKVIPKTITSTKNTMKSLDLLMPGTSCIWVA